MDKDEKNSQTPWHTLDAGSLRDLQVHENGLNVEAASQRLHLYGPNQLREAPRPGFWITLWDQLK